MEANSDVNTRLLTKQGELHTAEQEVLALIAPLGKLGRFEKQLIFFSS